MCNLFLGIGCFCFKRWFFTFKIEADIFQNIKIMVTLSRSRQHFYRSQRFFVIRDNFYFQLSPRLFTIGQLNFLCLFRRLFRYQSHLLLNQDQTTTFKRSRLRFQRSSFIFQDHDFEYYVQKYTENHLCWLWKCHLDLQTLYSPIYRSPPKNVIRSINH